VHDSCVQKRSDFDRASGGVVSLTVLLMLPAFGCKQRPSAIAPSPAPSPVAPSPIVGSTAKANESAEPPSVVALPAAVEARIRELVGTADGKIGVSVVHVESGRRVTVGGQQWLPLQSVFKLPLAVVVLREVQAGQVSLDQMLTVTATDRAPGVASNEKKWAQVPKAASVRQLLEYSLVNSDNTASDKLLGLIGGPTVLTEQMQVLGFEGIVVRAPTKAMGPKGELPNQATPDALASLLASVERGRLLAGPQRALLWDLLQRAQTGERRIRAGVPPGTPVLDKTGTGASGTATNDVGVVTLPGDRGHLAMAVMIAECSLPARAQEDLIAEVARAAFNAFGEPH
jgi:beta-lactamase class A